MTNNFKKWLIRKSEKVNKLTKIKKVVSIILLLILIIWLFIDSIILIKIWWIIFLLAIIMELIEDLLNCINRNKKIILQNKMYNVLLSDQRFIGEYFNYIFVWPIIWLSLSISSNIPEKNFAINIVMLIVLVISLFVLETKLSEKISDIFKQKLS